MASATMAVSFGFSYSPFCPRRTPLSRGSVRLAPFHKAASLKLSSSHCISAFSSVLPRRLCSVSPSPCSPRSLTIFSAKGYKRKTHKASAKRFRVTGRGKIVRRRAGKQHLLAKKNNKRKLRLSKMHPVSRSDYDNVIGALPYLKVNRKAT
ncbi:50S ribosomal protein L35 [Morus notabilis]|uniref:50S ribosomal protein L35 n=1 Tax=Morus notabilis TaxID=981085 RepID=W9SHK1_9ROSA|nr:50S ribosomal protein L35, chloroplastic [Morus notabilis]EXC30165.1 50S ribosomal protein L35 [Morus notabilis]